MADITFSNETVQYISMATKYTKAAILDCIVEDDRIIFVVEKGQIGLALGSKAKNLDKLRMLFKKNVKFVEYDNDKERFIRNLCKPYQLNEVSFDGDNQDVLVKIIVNPQDKSKLIGKGGRNINMIRKIAQRHHPIKDVQIK
jgi:transcription termination/antitermination protein NusA